MAVLAPLQCLVDVADFALAGQEDQRVAHGMVARDFVARPEYAVEHGAIARVLALAFDRAPAHVHRIPAAFDAHHRCVRLHGDRRPRGPHRPGRLHHLGSAESDPGLSSADALASSAVGRSHGLVFIDTIDGEAPRADNLGTLILDTEYIEALLVVQGHVMLKPSGAGRTLPVLSPAPEATSSLSSRIPVTLSGIHLNGLLYAAGAITLERETRMYGALITAGTVATGSSAPMLEVWYNPDFGKGFFRGLPVVYRAPGTWQVKY